MLRVEGVEFFEQLDAVVDRAGIGGLDEGEGGDVPEAERGHLEDDRGQVGSEDLGFGELVTGVVVLLGVEADADAGPDPAASAGPLVGRRLRHRFDGKALDLGPPVVAGDPGVAGVDDVADAGHGEGRLGHVGGQHDAAAPMGGEDPVLFSGREAGEEGEDLGVRPGPLLQRLGRLPDVPLAGQEHQDVAVALAGQLVDRVGDGLGLGERLVDGRAVRWPVADLDRVGPARDLDDGGGAVLGCEVVGEPFGVDGGRGDDDPQVGSAGEELAEVAEDEIDVEAAFVGLVDDDRVVAVEVPVPLELGQEDAVGHQLDPGRRPDPVVEPEAVADLLAGLDAELFGHPLGHGPGGQATRLGVADHPVASSASFQAELGQLGALPRAGLAGHDEDLVLGDGRHQLIAVVGDREFGREGEPGEEAFDRGTRLGGDRCRFGVGHQRRFSTRPARPGPARGGTR